MDSKFFSWIDSHLNDDPKSLRLKYSVKKDDIDYAAAITQIECRRKFGKKLADTLAADPHFIFPSVLAGEQATSDLLAAYHSSFVAEGLEACDLTAGLGIDVWHAAARASNVTAVELDHDRAEALRLNAATLDAHNVEVVEGDCTDFIERCISQGKHFASIFIDPARRSSDGSRVFALSDCAPDVQALMPRLRQICDILVIKASPMLDIAHTIAALSPTPLSVIAVGVPTECRELLIIIDFSADVAETMIEAVTLTGNASEARTFSFTASAERACEAPEAMRPLQPGDYIYESSPALMKSGAYKLVAKAYGLKGFHANTKLYASDRLVEDFPGMAYRVKEVLPYASRVLKRFARTYPQINVAVRNFGIGADALRSKLGVRDGGTLRLYGLTDARGEKVLAVVEPC
ncbi:MAG: RsmD family RNA methyltransferase [Muribaculaceae bacterium]|nr:RsmD family RNA methyltransferase [Muribaculaceae bacterium]